MARTKARLASDAEFDGSAAAAPPSPVILVSLRDAVERKTVTRVLYEAGYSVLDAPPDATARTIAAPGVRLVVLDMPQRTADRCLTQPEGAIGPPDPPIAAVYLTAPDARDSDRFAVLNDGGLACLKRPLDPVDLIATVRAYLRLDAIEAARQHDEASYRTLVQSAPIGIVVTSSDGEILNANPMACALLGYSGEEMLRLSLADIVIPNEADRLVPEIARLSAGTVAHSTWNYRRHDGSVFPGEVAATVLSDARLLGIFKDITERRQLEALARTREQDINEAQRIAGIGSWRWTPATGAIEWSDGMRLILGLPAGFPAPTFDTLSRYYTPESWERLTVAAARILESGDPDELETEMVCGDGRPRWTKIRAEAERAANGTVATVKGIIQDIDERKRAELAVQHEQALGRAIVESLPGLFYLLDEQGRLLRWNRNFERAAGRPASELQGCSALDFFREDRSLVADRIRQVFETGEAFVEASFVGSNGHSQSCLFSGTRVSFNDRPCLIGLGIDISARREQERELRHRAERHLQQRNALIALSNRGELYRDDPVTSFRQITEVAARTLDVARVSIWRYDADRGGIRCHDLFELGAERHSAGTQLSSTDFPAYFRAMAEESVIVADDAHCDPRTAEFSEPYLKPLQISSMLDAPIRLGGVVEGVLCHEHIGPARQWTSDEAAFAVALANLASLVLEAWQHRQTEESLRDGADKHRVLFEDSAEATLLMDASGFVDANAAAVRMFGAGDRSQFQRLSPATISPPTQPDGRPSSEWSRTLVTEAHRLGKLEFQWTHRRFDGTTFPSEVSLAALTVSGRPMLMATVRDITARLRTGAELRLQSAALNAASDAMVITDRTGLIVWVNAAFSALTGYDPAEGKGKRPRDLLYSGAQGDAFYRTLWETILAGRVWRGELTNRRKDGTLYPEDMVITPVKDEAGAITHFIAIKRDLTDQRRLEAQFLQAQKMEAIGTLAGGIAHDFNNILGAILGCTEMAVQDAAGNEAVIENLAQVTAAGRRATALVRHLVAFSGQQEQARVPIALEPVVKEAVALLRASLPASVALEWSSDPAAPRVFADPTQIHQIVMNLGINAWHALDGRAGVIGIGLDAQVAPVGLRADSLAPCARLTVRDSGHGMDSATQARIFEPFFTTKAPGEGTGLGLATVHGIMKSYGGSIDVSSQVGAGTTFTLCFPAAPLDEDEASADTAVTNDSVPRGEGQHILFVDDERSLVVAGTDTLDRLGYRVTGLASAIDALATFTDSPQSFDLVVSDLTMPGMTGIELAERVHALRPDLPILFVTGYLGGAVGAQAVRRYGNHAVLTKPVDAATLGRAVGRAFQKD